MHRLSIDAIVANINKGAVFEAVSEDYSFTLKIAAYVPYVCAAVHDGHQFRKSLWPYCLHTEYERWYEEDPCTKQMVRSHAIVIAGLDSRFEYDLNRDPDTAIYVDAWGKTLWKAPLPDGEKRKSLAKHEAFYRVVHALLQKLESIHKQVMVFDMHSYNWKRWHREVPTWNLGTANIDNGRFGKIVDMWREKLAAMVLPHGIRSTAKINDTFQGNGYFLKYITQNFDHTLVLATEIAKVYCDEADGTVYPEVVASVEDQLRNLVPLQVKEFERHFT
ncbi:MAG: N-formylglutamate amidohydrolase [Bacteroidota bacterium]